MEKVVSGDQNSLRGQIGLERVLRWSQARTGAVCRMQHKYRPGETAPGNNWGIIMFLATRCKIAAAAAAAAAEELAVAVVVAGQRHTGRQRVAMLLQARSRLGEPLAMATVACPMHTKSKSRDRFIARPITAQCRPATAFSEARCHARAKFTTTSPQAGASNTPEHPSATLRDKCYRVQNSPNELGRIRLSTKELSRCPSHQSVICPTPCSMLPVPKIIPHRKGLLRSHTQLF